MSEGRKNGLATPRGNTNGYVANGDYSQNRKIHIMHGTSAIAWLIFVILLYFTFYMV